MPYVEKIVGERGRIMTKLLFRLAVILFLLWPSIGWSMEASLTQSQVDDAIVKGKKWGKLWRWDFDPYGDPVGKFFKQYEFGDRSTCNYGQVYTRFNEVVRKVMAYTKANEEIDWNLLRFIIEEKSFAITIHTCQVAKNVQKNQVVLKQGMNMAQPEAITGYENYMIVYYFFDQIDPQKAATLVIFKDSEHEFEYKIDFSLMP